jgi:TonB-linked SusC/RagA family outer membrane protein
MRVTFTLLLFLFSFTVSAQTIQGYVSDEKTKEPLIGATVEIKKAKKGVVTDLSGKFSIQGNVGDVLNIHYTGFESINITVTDSKEIKVSLKSVAEQLKEAVVVGYGTKTRKDITGSISSVSTKEMDKRPLPRLENMLQGQAAGVQVTQFSGKPGNALSIRVRGATSISAGSEPLYVLDGIPLLNAEGINAADIASIEVLKDASASAIYGARAANGVVLITTKLGEAGTSQASFNSYYGFSEVTKKLSMLGTPDYIDLINESYVNSSQAPRLDPAAYTENTNWQDEIFRRAATSNYQLTFSGGDRKNRYYLSMNRQNQEGIVKGSDYVRTGLRLKMLSEVNPKLRIGTNISVNNNKYDNVPDNSRVNQGGVILGALSSPTLIGIYKADGTYTVNPLQAWENPVANIEAPLDETNTLRLVGNMFFEYDIIKDLTFKSSFSTETYFSKNNYFLDPFRTQYGRSLKGIGSNSTNQELVWLAENTLTYKKQLGNHNLEFLGGYTAQASRYESTYARAEGFPNASVTTLNAGSRKAEATSYASEWALLSYLGRVSYKYKSAYLADFNMRVDGSSRFGKSNRYGYFPSASIGWRISDERFMPETKWVDDLKVRLSVGANGNQNIGDYASYGLYAMGANYNFNGTIYPGTRPSTIGNANLKWESTIQYNLGLDYSFLNYAVTVTADYYIKRTKDLLVNVDLPLSTGFSSGIQNLGEIENKGFELGIRTRNLATKDFNWVSNFNFSANRNNVISIGGEDKVIYGGDIPEKGYTVIVKEGMPLGAFYGYNSEGVDPNTGNIIFTDLNGDGVIDDLDRKVIGNATPDFMIGFNNTISYKNFDLDFLFQGCYGNEVFNATRIETEGMFSVKNGSITTLDRWQNVGDQTSMPIAIFGDPNKNSRISNRFIEDGSFLRLRSVTLSYHVPTKWVSRFGINRFDAYVSGQNLFVITNYSGYDPEVNRDGGNSISQGIDYGTYPQSRTIIGGVKIDF